MADWQTYYEQNQSRPTRKLLVRALNFCKSREKALDIGAGNLIESRYLLDSGFKEVIAVDRSEEIKGFAEKINDARLKILNNPFQDMVLTEDEFDLINAQYALPFYGPKEFEEFISKLINSLKSGGVFVGQFFGNRDGWRSNPNLAFHTKAEALALLKNLKIKEFTEEEREGVIASGESKHWHIFHFIAVK